MTEKHYRTPEQIERLAIQAARAYLGNNQKDLTKAIMQTVKDERDLTAEHIKRICEITNTTVLQNLLKTERDKTIGFPLANPENIIKEYGTEPVVPTAPASQSDYELPPKIVLKEEIAKREQPTLEATREIVKNLPKDPYADPMYQPPVQKAASIYNQCTIAQEWLSGKLQSTDIALKTAEENLRSYIKDQLLVGTLSLGELEKLATDRQTIKPYVRDVFRYLARSGAILSLEEVQMGKAASAREISEEYQLEETHPVVVALEQITKLQETIDSLAEALDVINLKKAQSHRVLIHEV